MYVDVFGRTIGMYSYTDVFVHNLYLNVDQVVQGGFFNWSALKMTKCQITCKSLQKSSKCQNFLRVWHLVIFRADQLKNHPVYHLCINQNCFLVLIRQVLYLKLLQMNAILLLITTLFLVRIQRCF